MPRDLAKARRKVDWRYAALTKNQGTVEKSHWIVQWEDATIEEPLQADINSTMSTKNPILYALLDLSLTCLLYCACQLLN